MRKMRVGVLVNGFNPEVGGAHNFVTAVMEALLLEEFGSELELLYLVEDKKVQESLKTFVPVGRSARIEKIIITLFTSNFGKFLLPLLLRINPLHVSIRKSKLDFMFFLGSSPIPLEIPFGVIVWDLQHRTHPWFPELKPGWENREHLAKLVLPRASIVITGTSEGRNQIVNFYGVHPDNIHIIPHPVPPDIYSDKFTEPGPTFKLLYPAQFWPHKNHLVIINAIKLFIETNKKDVKVIFVGSDKGNLSYIQREIEKQGVTQYFDIRGFVSRSELLELYKSSDALVYASFSGPENLPPLEAFASYLPVIYADFPGAREQLGASALYFNPLNEDELKDRIQELMISSNLGRRLTELGLMQLKGRTNKDFVRTLRGILENFSHVRSRWE